MTLISKDSSMILKVVQTCDRLKLGDGVCHRFSIGYPMLYQLSSSSDCIFVQIARDLRECQYTVRWFLLPFNDGGTVA